MSKKQLRITAPHKIKEQIGNFINKQISLVMQDNTVIFGVLTRADGDMLTLKNTRQKKIKIPTGKVLEFFTDIDA